MGAREHVLALIDGAWTTQAIAAGCELGLFDALARGPRDAATLARELDVDRDAIARLARALATLGLCADDGTGRFALTDDGQCLRADAGSSLHGWARMAGTRLWANWGVLAQCVRAGRSAREMRGHADFGELELDPDAARAFNAAMVDLTRPVASAAAAMLDWKGVSTIVDVGGGTGALAAGILARHPRMRALVADLSHARPSAEAFLAAEGVGDRCEFVAADFFAGVPGGCDVYLLKSVLHNWNDERALEILRACRRSMGAAARIVILERLEPVAPARDASSREVARSDLNMLVGCGGRERTASQFQSLLTAAGFGTARVTPLANGFHALET